MLSTGIILFMRYILKKYLMKTLSPPSTPDHHLIPLCYCGLSSYPISAYVMLYLAPFISPIFGPGGVSPETFWFLGTTLLSIGG